MSSGDSKNSFELIQISLEKIKQEFNESHQRLITKIESIEYCHNFSMFKFPTIKNLKNPEDFFSNVEACLKDRDYSSILNMVIQK